MTPKSDHEEDMSMEEILASIRKFVTDSPAENLNKPRAYKGELAESVVIPPANHATGREPLENPHRPALSQESMLMRQHESGILDLKSASPVGASRGVTSGWKESAEAAQPEAYKAPQEESIMTLSDPLESRKTEKLSRQPTKMAQLTNHEESLGSSYAMSASANSLSRLAQATKFAPKKGLSSLADQRNLTLDQLIQDMIRPMIKQWIDTHLPSLVEEMVAKEIKRITKHLG